MDIGLMAVFKRFSFMNMKLAHFSAISAHPYCYVRNLLIIYSKISKKTAALIPLPLHFFINF